MADSSCCCLCTQWHQHDMHVLHFCVGGPCRVIARHSCGEIGNYMFIKLHQVWALQTELLLYMHTYVCAHGMGTHGAAPGQ